MREMWMKPVPDGDIDADQWSTAGHRRRSASAAVGTVVLGVLPGPRVAGFGADLTDLTSAFGSIAPAVSGSEPTPVAVRRVLHGRGAVRRAGVLRDGRVGPGAAATSSPRPRSGRCSVPSSLGASTPSGDRLGRPDTFTVVDVGAGPGTLARSILTRPALRRALRLVAVERLGGPAGDAIPMGSSRVPSCRPSRSTA